MIFDTCNFLTRALTCVLGLSGVGSSAKLEGGGDTLYLTVHQGQ